MWDLIEALVAGLTVIFLLGMIATFVLVMRYIAYKEKTALRAYGLEKETTHE